MVSEGPVLHRVVDGVQTSGTRRDDTLYGSNPRDLISDGPESSLAISENTIGVAAFDLFTKGWSYKGGSWTYVQRLFERTDAGLLALNDLIAAGAGSDLVLAKGGHDLLYGNGGKDRLKAGSGDDFVYGGMGDDLLHLGDGGDRVEGGDGNDRIYSGAGDDLVYGDGSGENLLLASASDENATGFAGYEAGANWKVSHTAGNARMVQTLAIEKGVHYQISFDLAANPTSGAGGVAVFWNGERLGRFEADSSTYKTHVISVVGDGKTGALLFKEFETTPRDGPEIHSDQPVFYYDSAIRINGKLIEVSAIASGQTGLFYVKNGQLARYDGNGDATIPIGDAAGFPVGALGYNGLNDLIYGIAEGKGVDDRGKIVNAGDLVIFDAKGMVFRAGATGSTGVAGDFDGSGNLWIFDDRLNRITKVEVDNFNAFGNPVGKHFDLPRELFPWELQDLTYSATENLWFGVVAPASSGTNGRLLRIDLEPLEAGGYPTVTSLEINRTLTPEGFEKGMPVGTVSSVFMNGEGDLFFSADVEDRTGIYQLHTDSDAGAAFVRLRGTTGTTGYDDGAIDPHGANLFADRDPDASFYLRNPSVQAQGIGEDILRGGAGDDELYGGAGHDKVFGGAGADRLWGGDGGDRLEGGRGRDYITGESGADKISAGTGADYLYGGSDKDELLGEGGDDLIWGGSDADRIFGGLGADRLDGGEGNDNLWGGGYAGDSDGDIFVFSAASGRDYIHDFDAALDRIDLSAFHIDWAELRDYLSDQSWASVIELYAFAGGSSGDRIILPDVEPATLGEENFIL
ncbi:calcium-binding protein [Neptunicoccus cionae]|uniref:calcium-binding protein n=1 Tax=Neptunicoccus cionae TaxID=2035344 RepID=UPI000C756E2F|nr:hypothetical protein [Amylibacter cionae]PLS22705.1 hypothetical protein C0U40_00700 [Amylibacter cionae]